MSKRTLQQMEAEMAVYMDDGNIGKVMDLTDEIGNLYDRLLYDAQAGDIDEIEEVESLGIDITKENDSIFMTAAVSGQVEMLEYLFNRFPDHQEQLNSSVRVAAERGLLEMTQYLVLRGGDVNIAIEVGDSEITQWAVPYKQANDFRLRLDKALPEKQESTPRIKI
ncbi:hypothetical protein [Burkholderia vietnamiensis]|uniref:hypothetical protein n=1 Tax=Burkholderia vietnamiensis TaxID=60552 RepID=UPI001588505A|nr:hypothetical protein [Burkholderia vietnamiensis]